MSSYKVLRVNPEKGTMVVEFEKDGKIQQVNAAIPSATSNPHIPGSKEYEEKYMETINPFKEEIDMERSPFNAPPKIVDLDNL